MNKTKIGLIGLLIAGVVVGATAGPSPANAALTLGALTVTSDGALTVTGAAGSVITVGATTQSANIVLGSSSGTSSVLIGNGAGASTVSIAHTGVAGNTVNIAGGDTATTKTDTVNIATGNPVDGASGGKVVNIATGTPGTGGVINAVTIGSTAVASSLTLQSGTGDVTITSTDAIKIGEDAAAQLISIGNVTDATSLTLEVGTGNFSLDGVDVSTYTIGAATTSGTFAIGGTSQTGNLNIGVSSATLNALNIGTGTGITNINIGTDNTAADVIIIGSALDNVDLAGEDIALTSADDLHILGGSAGSIINIGTNVDGNAINVGTDNSAADTIVIGSALDTSSLLGISVTVGSSGTTSALILNSGTGDIVMTSTDDISILGGSAGSVINVGTNVDGNAINVGTNNTAADTIIVGSALDDVDLAGEDIALTSADDLHILGGSAGSIINIGTNVDGNAINVGTDNSAADTIVIGSALDTSSLLGISVTVGSTGTTSQTNIESGTGRIHLVGQLVSEGAVPTATQSAGTPTIAATSTDTAGSVISDATSHTTVIITFAATYTAAPVCVISPYNSAGAVLYASAGGAWADTSATALTITHAADTTLAGWNYVCVKNE